MKKTAKKQGGPTAGDVMTTPVTTVREDMAVEQLVDLMRSTHFTGYPVVDGDGRPVGLISQSDVLRGLARVVDPEFAKPFLEKGSKKGSKLADAAREGAQASAVLLGLMIRPVRELMTSKVEVCRPETPLARACDTMQRLRIHRVVVVDRGGKVVGLLSALDIVRWLAKELG